MICPTPWMTSSARRSPRTRSGVRRARRRSSNRSGKRSARSSSRASALPSSGPGPAGSRRPATSSAPEPAGARLGCAQRSWRAPSSHAWPSAPCSRRCCSTTMRPPPEVPVPAVAEGAQPLGSSLPEPALSVGCGGVDADAGSKACAIAQPELSGGGLVAPSDGKIVGWAVRGARGEMSLDVIRPRGADTVRVNNSQFESAGNEAPHYFPTALTVEEGDLLGVRLAPGSRIGASEREGAETERWLDPLGGLYGLPDKGAGLEDELALRADFVPNERVPQPEQLRGAAAADAPAGTVRERARGEDLEASVARGRGGRRDRRAGGPRPVSRRASARLACSSPDSCPAARRSSWGSDTLPGEGYVAGRLFWVNPNSGRLFYLDFSAAPSGLTLLD